MTEEKIDHPAHYGGDVKYEAIKIIDDWGLGFSAGNALKYILRAPHKRSWAEDMRKAEWYLRHAYEIEEGFTFNKLTRMVRMLLAFPFSFRPRDDIRHAEVSEYWKLREQSEHLPDAIEHLSNREYLPARECVILALREKGIAT